MKHLYFAHGSRQVLCLPLEMRQTEGEDDLHPGRRQWTLGFTLKRGCYATLVIKRLFAPTGLH